MAPTPVFLARIPRRSSTIPGPHPEQIERILALTEELDRRGWLGLRAPCIAGGRARSAAPPSTLSPTSSWIERAAARRRRRARRRHGDQRGLVHRRAPRRRRRHRARRGARRRRPRARAVSAPTGRPAIMRLPARAMGFCLFNNVAVAARHAIDVARAASGCIDPRLGRPPRERDERHLRRRGPVSCSSRSTNRRCIRARVRRLGCRRAAGRGYTVNLPVPAGSGDAVFCRARRRGRGPARAGVRAGARPDLRRLRRARATTRSRVCQVTEAGLRRHGARRCRRSATSLGRARVRARGRLRPRRARRARSPSTMEAIAGRRARPAAGAHAGIDPALSRQEQRGRSQAPLVREALARIAPFWPALAPSGIKQTDDGGSVTDEEQLISGVDFVAGADAVIWSGRSLLRRDARSAALQVTCPSAISPSSRPAT